MVERNNLISSLKRPNDLKENKSLSSSIFEATLKLGELRAFRPSCITFDRKFDHKKGQIIVTQLAKVFKCIGLSKAQLGTFNICPSADDVIWRRTFLISYILKMTSRIWKKEIEKRCSPYRVAKGSTTLLNRPTHPAQTLVNHLIENTMANVK